MPKEVSFVVAIEQIMRDNGGYAPLKLIYAKLPQYKDLSKLKGGTPFDTAREKVQRNKRFKRIGLGVYALAEVVSQLPIAPIPETPKQKKGHRHAEIQGMLLEIGNDRNDIKGTYTADPGYLFGRMELGKIATMKELPSFTYEAMLKNTVRYVDVAWFNERGFPDTLFEVEHSTDFRDALLRFGELQDFRTRFCCVAERAREKKFQQELSLSSFGPIRDRCEFRSYEDVEYDYQTALRKQRI